MNTPPKTNEIALLATEKELDRLARRYQRYRILACAAMWICNYALAHGKTRADLLSMMGETYDSVCKMAGVVDPTQRTPERGH